MRPPPRKWELTAFKGQLLFYKALFNPIYIDAVRLTSKDQGLQRSLAQMKMLHDFLFVPPDTRTQPFFSLCFVYSMQPCSNISRLLISCFFNVTVHLSIYIPHWTTVIIATAIAGILTDNLEPLPVGISWNCKWYVIIDAIHCFFSEAVVGLGNWTGT